MNSNRSLVTVLSAFIYFLTFSNTSAAFFETQLPLKDINYNKTQCPTVHPTHTGLINKMNDLKDKIDREAKGCQTSEQKNIDRTLKDLDIFLSSKDRKAAFQIYETASQKALTPLKAKKVKNYTSTAVRLFSKLVGHINSSGCFKKEKTKAEALADASQIVSEVTQVTSTVSGPYGAPLATFGSLTSSVLGGLSAYISSIDGYDFDLKPQRDAYNQTLCSYYEVRKQLMSAINPQQRVSELNILKESLLRRLEDLSENCIECEKIIKAYLFTPEAFNFNDTQWLDLADKVDAQFTQPVGQITLQTINDLEWTLKEQEQWQNLQKAQYSSRGPAELVKLKIELDQFLLKSQAERYVNWSIENAEDNFKMYNAFTNWWIETLTLPLYRTEQNKEIFERRFQGQLNHEWAYGFFLKLEDKIFKPGDNFEFRLDTHYQKSQDHFQLFYFNVKGIQEHCDFFNTLRLSTRVRKLCASKNITKLKNKVSAIMSDAAKSTSENSILLFSDYQYSQSKNTGNKTQNWLEALKKQDQQWEQNKIFELRSVK